MRAMRARDPENKGRRQRNSLLPKVPIKETLTMSNHDTVYLII